MNKKTNTVIFILVATVFNVIFTLLCFLLLLLIFSQFLFPVLPEDSVAWALPILFVLSIVASFFVYRILVKYLMKKVDVEKYFDPLFSRRPPRKP